MRVVLLIRVEPVVAAVGGWLAADGAWRGDAIYLPASGQKIRVEGMSFYRLKDGRVTEVWTQFDGVAMMQQLGAIPG